MKYILFFLCLCAFHHSYTQDCHLLIKGKVIDQHDGKPLEGAIINIFGSDQEVYSDRNGDFVLEGLCHGFYELEISHIACGTKIIPLRLEKTLSRTFYLEHHIEVLNEVALVKNTFNSLEQQSITTAVLEAVTVQNFADALTQIQGISTLKTGNSIAKPLIQGMYGSRIITNNQGVRMQDMEWGAEHAPNIATGSVEGVSLAVGAKSLSYGGDAIGGVIILDPRKPSHQNKQKQAVIFSGFTNGRGFLSSQKYERDFENGMFYGIHTAFKKAGNNTNTQGYLLNTGFEQTSISIPLGWHLDQKGFDVYMSYFRANNGILRNAHIGNLQDLISQINGTAPRSNGNFTYDIENPRQDVTHLLAKISAYYYFENLGKWTIQYDYQKNNRKEFDIRLGDRNKLPGTDLALQTHGLQSRFKLDSAIDKVLEFGAEVSFQDHFPNPATGVKRLIPDYKSLHLGAYIFGSKSFSEHFEVQGSIRTDWLNIQADKYYNSSRWESLGYANDFSSFLVEDFNTQVLTAPKLSYQTQAAALTLQYQKAKHQLNAHLQYVERAPNPAELFSEGLHHSAARIELGSLRMKKEKASKIGAQYSYSSNKRSFLIAPYINYVNDYMALLPSGIEFTIRGAFPVWEYTQTNAFFWGADIEWTEKLSPNMTMTHGGSLVKATDRIKKSPFPNIPPVNTRHQLTKTFSKIQGFKIELNGNYNFRQNEVPEDLMIFNPNTKQDQLLAINRAPKAFFLLSSVAEYQFPKSGTTQYKLRLSGENLTNLNYQNYLNRLRYFSNELGININLQFQINF